MNALTSQSAQVLIVTDNFIEAADLKEALGTAGSDTVLHLRSVVECCAFLDDPALRPWLSVVSYRRSTAGLNELTQTLVKRGSALLLIDAPAKEARALGGVALARPFTSANLTEALNLIQQGRDPSQCEPTPL